MIKKLKKLVEKHGAAQVCVWLGIKDTRTLNTWISRDSIPFHRLGVVDKTVRQRS